MTRHPITACLLASLMLSACSDNRGPATSGPAPGGPLTTGLDACGAPPLATDKRVGRTDATVGLLQNGRKLDPEGQMTTLGNFPTGGALSPDGRYYWAVNSGHGANSVSVLDVQSWTVQQTLPLPGSYGELCFGPLEAGGGYKAFVAGGAKGKSEPEGPTKADGGDAIHVFQVNGGSGQASELEAIQLSRLPMGTMTSARRNLFPPPTNTDAVPLWPTGCAVSPDGGKLVVALNQADRAAVIDLLPVIPASVPNTQYVTVGNYPIGVAIEPSGQFAYVSNQYDGTLSKINLATRAAAATITVGGGTRVPDTLNNTNSHPQAVLVDPIEPRLFVSITNRDLIAVVNTVDNNVEYVNLARPEAIGVAPVSLALSPNRDTLYVANAGEDAIVAIALTARGALKKYDVIGKLPTAFYPTDVVVTNDGGKLIWLAAKGLGSGANPTRGTGLNLPDTDPSYLPRILIGRAGILSRPGDAQMATLTARVDKALRPSNFSAPLARTSLHGALKPDGSYEPSADIKYVFYVVKENRTYDQIFGCEARGDGDCALEVIGDNGKGGPTSGVTPNNHALARMFPLLTHVYANSEVSIDGHLITSGAYASDYSTKALHPDYSSRGKVSDTAIAPVSFGPKHFLVDQAARQGITFRIWGERGTGNVPGIGNDGRVTYPQVEANADPDYASQAFSGCFPAHPGQTLNEPNCYFDADIPQLNFAQSRLRVFRQKFPGMVASGQVPRFNYLLLYNDHTDGTTIGQPTPKAKVADNDWAMGQLVETISNSAIWPQSLIIFVEDDVQDGADSVDAHRMPAFVISPWAKHGAVVHTRYDQVSLIRTLQLVLGMKPLSLQDAYATPMYDAFTCEPDNAKYTAIRPEQDLLERNTAVSANAALSAALPFDLTDRVPQAISDRILWQSVFGADAAVPPSGPNASPAEAERAAGAMRIYNSAKTPAEARRLLHGYLEESAEDEDE